MMTRCFCCPNFKTITRSVWRKAAKDYRTLHIPSSTTLLEHVNLLFPTYTSLLCGIPTSVRLKCWRRLSPSHSVTFTNDEISRIRQQVASARPFREERAEDLERFRTSIDAEASEHPITNLLLISGSDGSSPLKRFSPAKKLPRGKKHRQTAGPKVEGMLMMSQAMRSSGRQISKGADELRK